MRNIRVCLAAVLSAAVLSIGLNAQTSAKPAQGPAHAKVRQEPCWQVAGISQSAKEQRDAVANDRRSQIQAVCADTSLNPQQKKQKIHQIREEAKQKIQGLITPEQEEQLQACQKERAGEHASAPAAHPGAGPCGESVGESSAGGSAQH